MIDMIPADFERFP